jgi:hypothetical protein
MAFDLVNFILLFVALAAIVVGYSAVQLKRLASQGAVVPLFAEQNPPIEVAAKSRALTVLWQEPNRGEAKKLHVSNSGERTSTVTGAFWLDDHRFVANHRAGQRVALFDLREGHEPLCIASVDFLTDDISAIRISQDVWHVVVSGCWDQAYATFELVLKPVPEFRHLSTVGSQDRTFSHGCTYDREGEIWLAYSVGKDPRIQNGHQIWRLPKPWGARKVCFDSATGDTYAVANTNTPKTKSYEDSALGIWRLDKTLGVWNLLRSFSGAHGDALGVYGGHVWAADQVSDTLLGIPLDGGQDIRVKCGLSFPHGLGISPRGRIAITNYGDSTITVLDLNAVLDDARNVGLAAA